MEATYSRVLPIYPGNSSNAIIIQINCAFEIGMCRIAKLKNAPSVHDPSGRGGIMSYVATEFT